MSRQRPAGRLSGLIAAGLVAGAFAGCGDDNPVTPADTDLADTDSADAGADTDASADASTDAGPDASDATADADPDTADDAADDAAEITEGAFVSTPTTWVEAGTQFVYAAAVEPEGLQIVLLEGPEGASIDDAGVLTWDAPLAGDDTATFQLAAVSGDNQVDAQSFEIRVDHAPVFLNSPAATIPVGEVWSFAPTAFDEDGDAVVVTLIEGPEWLALEGSDADAVVSGTPDVAGDIRFTLRAAAGELATEMSFELEGIQRIRDLRADGGPMLTSGADLPIFGCCFDEAPRVFWGAIEATSVVRVNAAALDVTFGPLPTGQQTVSLVLGDREIGVIEEPVLAIPAIEDRISGLAVLGDFDEDTDVDVIDLLSGTPLIASASATEEGMLVPWPAGGAVVRIEVDGVGSAPVVWGVPADVLVVEVEPPVHTAGMNVAIGFSAAAPDVRLHWGSSSAACVSLGDPLRCIATVPFGASGPLVVRSDDALVPRVVAAGAPSSVVSPELTGANRTTLPADVETLVVLDGIGFDAASATLEGTDAAARLVWRSPSSAIAAITATGATPAVRLTVGSSVTSWIAFDVIAD